MDFRGWRPLFVKRDKSSDNVPGIFNFFKKFFENWQLSRPLLINRDNARENVPASENYFSIIIVQFMGH